MAGLKSIAASALICLWINPYAPGPAPAMVPLLLAWSLAAVGTFLMVFVSRNDTEDFVSGIWLIAALVSCVIGLVQFGGISGQFSGWMNTTQPGEAFANLRQRNQFASLTNIGLLALIYLCRSHASLTRRYANGAMVAAVLLGIGNAASSSRTGLLQLVAVVAVFAIWSQWHLRNARPIVFSALVAYLLATLLLPVLIGQDLGSGGLLGRLGERTPACQSRWVLWGNVMTLIAQKPWLGWGWGELDYAHFVTLYPGDTSARFCDILDNAHNLPLHLAVELGIPFAAVVCLLLVGLMGWLRPWGDQNPARQMAWGVLLVIGLHSLLEYPLWYGPFQIAVALCVLILWRTHHQRGSADVAGQLNPLRVGGGDGVNGVIGVNGVNVGSHDGESGAEQPRDGVPKVIPNTIETVVQKKRGIVDRIIALLATNIIALCGYAMWDYHRVSQIYLAPSERSAAYRYNTFAKIQGSWLFQNHVQFAELTTTAVTPENAAYLHAQAQRLLHFSPEARVAEKLIDCALLLGLNDDADFFKQRYQAAFPEAFAAWQVKRNRN